MSTAVNDYLLREGPRIGTNVTQVMMGQKTPWLTLYRQETWEEQTSAVQGTFQFDRAQLVADEVSWANVARDPAQAASGLPNAGQLGDSEPGPGTGTYAIPPADEVKYTQTSRQFRLQSKAIWGPRMSTNDLRDAIVRNKQMTAAAAAMADQAREIWINRKRSEYTRIAGKKIILDSNFEANMSVDAYNTIFMPDIANGGDAGTGNGSILTGGHLDYIYEYMNHQGGGEGALGTESNRPIYAFVTSGRASRRVITENTDKRQDFRFSDRNAELLGPMGVKLQLNGWAHIIDEKITRFNLYRTASAVGSGANKFDGTETATSVYTAANGSVAAYTTVTLSAQICGGDTPTKTITVGSEFIMDIAGTPIKYIVASVSSVAGSINKVFNIVDESGVAPASLSTKYFSLWMKVPMFKVIGGKNVPNPQWLSAGWEDGYVFHQSACCSLVPSPITSSGGASFNAVNYSGEYAWKNYENETTNPDGTIGRFRGVLMSGTRPDRPELAVVVRYRCGSGGYGAITDMTTLG